MEIIGDTEVLSPEQIENRIDNLVTAYWMSGDPAVKAGIENEIESLEAQLPINAE